MSGSVMAAQIIWRVRSIYFTIFNSTLPSLLTHIGRDVGGAGIIHARNEFQKNLSRGSPDRNSDVTGL